MTLRVKTGIIIAAIMLAAAVVLFVVFQGILSRHVARVERIGIRNDVDRVVNAVAYHVKSIDEMLSDWAAWDDTYKYLHDRNSEYASSNLLPESFAGLHINSMVFMDDKDRLFWGKQRVIRQAKFEPLSAGLLAHLRPGSPLLKLEPTDTSRRIGIVLVSGRPTMIAARPILTSIGRGPSRGTMLMTRDIDAEEVQQLSAIVRLPLKIVARGPGAMPADFRWAERRLSSANKIVLRPTSDATVAGYALLRDVYGKSVAIARVEAPRYAHAQARTSSTYLGLSLLAVALLSSVGAIGLMNRAVLSPLASLTTDVKGVGARGDLAARVGASRPGRNDELANLAGDINEMLDALESSQKALVESQEELHLALEELETERQKMEELARTTIDAQERERRYLAAEIHDDLVQSLVATSLFLQATDDTGASRDMRAQKQRLVDILQESVKRGRALIREIEPSRKPDISLVQALSGIAELSLRDSGVHVDFVYPDNLPDVSDASKTNILRIAQEAVINVRKHAQASKVSIKLSVAEGQLHLRIEDDGVGFDAEEVSGRVVGHFGIPAMQGRADLTGGRLTVESERGKGTVVSGSFPLG